MIIGNNKYTLYGTNDVNFCNKCDLVGMCDNNELLYKPLCSIDSDISDEYKYHYYKKVDYNSVDILRDFCVKISKQKDCPVEFIDIVNDEFWNLI